MKTFVYVISGDHGRQKIGSSDNPRQRIKELQTGSPYKLRFEFVGETEERMGGQVEVEAQFMLNAHKAPGGDEWFVVPSDAAITAVMAAAHRLGYRIRPVDPDRIAAQGFGKRPLWAMLPSLALGAWWCFSAFPRLESGEMPTGTFVIEGAVVLLVMKLLQLFIKWSGYQIMAAWTSFDRAMHPENEPKVPLPD